MCTSGVISPAQCPTGEVAQRTVVQHRKGSLNWAVGIRRRSGTEVMYISCISGFFLTVVLIPYFIKKIVKLCKTFTSHR